MGGNFLLINKISEGQQIHQNGAILVISAILKNVMVSTGEAEPGGLFLNGKETGDLRERFLDTGHPQNEPTPIKTDNSIAMDFTNNKIKQRGSKAMDMRVHWVRDRTK